MPNFSPPSLHRAGPWAPLRAARWLLALVLLLALPAARLHAQVLARTFAASDSHSLSIHADGTLWATGDNTHGELAQPPSMRSSNAWVQVGTATNWVQVAAGNFHSLGLRADGSLWAWGDNQYGQLGNPTNNGTNNANSTPTQVAGTYTQVAAGGSHSLGLRADGSLFAWGLNYNGQLGNLTGTGTENATPTPTPTQVGGTYTQVAAGGYHSLGLRADGTIFAWGSNYNGQLGTATNSGIDTANPTPTATGTALVTRSLAMGSNFGLAVRGDGTLWAWGDNAYGQLGLPTSTASTTRPAQVGTAHDWVMVAAGQLHSLGLRADGSLFAWGSNQSGQLGNATNNSTLNANPTPTQVAGTYTQVAAGQAHSLGLRADGSLFAWGNNQYGQLGNATSNGNSSAIPTQVAGTYTQVAAGGYHSLGRRADGSLFAWGYNYYGQLGTATGNGTQDATPTPTQVAGLYSQVAAGTYHSLSLRADGSLWAWGYNPFGQLGTGSTNAGGTPTPTREATLGTGWTTLGTGAMAYFSLVRTASAQNFASAGSNYSGQLGDGTTTDANRFDRLSPLLSLQPLPVLGAAAAPGLHLFPNPAPAGATTLTGATPGAPITVLDALGRPVAATTADASGTAMLTLPAGLPAGVYLVRAGQRALRLALD